MASQKWYVTVLLEHIEKRTKKHTHTESRAKQVGTKMTFDLPLYLSITHYFWIGESSVNLKPWSENIIFKFCKQCLVQLNNLR